MAASDATLRVSGTSVRLAALSRRLGRFSFHDIAIAAGGLLTEAENQPATFRLEMLATLAAVHADGVRRPTATHLREWLNDGLLRDDIGQLEDPLEDVFISNVPSPDGNRRLFDGLWGDNDTGVRALLQAVLRFSDRRWAADALASCLALLRLSETVAERTGVERYALSSGKPKQRLRIVSADLEAAKARVTFSIDALHELAIRAPLLEPFVLLDEHRTKIADETLGNTTFERRPLIWTDKSIVVALPTAIGPAIRRYIMECAREAGDLPAVEELVANLHLAELAGPGMAGLRLKCIRSPQPMIERCRDFVAEFDNGGVIHVVHVGEDLSNALDQGLRSLQQLPPNLTAKLLATAEDLASQEGYRRGLTVVVHAGIGRGFATMLPESIDNWHFTGVEQSDLARMWCEHEFDVLRLWKILDQDSHLAARGYGIHNVNGLTNLYGFMQAHSMAIVPDAVAPGPFEIATNFVANVRQRLRGLIDAHVAHGPGGGHWVEIQRTSLDVFFSEVERLPLYSSVADAVGGRFLSCVDTAARPWWIELEDTAATPTGKSVEYQVFDAAQNWLVRAAPRLDGVLPELPAGQISIRISVPGADELGGAPPPPDAPFGPPTVNLDDTAIVIACGADHLRSFGRAENIGERLLIAAIVRGAYALSGANIDDDQLAVLALEIAGSTQARFFHMLPPRTPSALVYAAADLGRPRLLQQEDVAWSRLGLAETSGWKGGSTSLSKVDAPVVLNAAVEALWARVRSQMVKFDREKLATFTLSNHDRVDWDRQQWAQTASALLALYRDQTDIISAFNYMESKRGMASLASRVIAEMAICTCPETTGIDVTKADFDGMLADVAVMIECANQSDAIRWDLVDRMPIVAPSGALNFDVSFQQTQQRPYYEAQGERDFRDSADTYESNFKTVPTASALKIDLQWNTAIETEYAISLGGLVRLASELANEAAAAGRSMLRLTRNELVARIAGPADDAPAINADRCYDALTLRPRDAWDEKNPVGAKMRDWYPWRFNRRLSLLQRPFLQVGWGENSVVLVHPTLLDHFVQRLLLTEKGLLPVELYSTKKMRSWIGTAVNREGHAFNRRVADRMVKIGWKARPDVKLTELGGTQRLGDVDVLAWHSESGLVLAIECKRLQRARSIGEIGERLKEYATLAQQDEERTPIQKHLDRITFLKTETMGLSKVTGIPIDRIRLHSALITDHLVPMQFSNRAAAFVDYTVDFRSLAEILSPHRLRNE